ncbi:MAG: PASTA domain-containing protein [Ruminococcaceae bacterium]|nr:PASTA domain-containing protein [Oscillospiraceae bacterium]
MDNNNSRKRKTDRKKESARTFRLFRSSAKPARASTSSVFGRTVFLTVVVGFLAFGALVGKLFQVQLVDYEIYQQKAVVQQTRNDIITPSRGTIYDRNGKQLAVSATVETVILNPAAVREADDPELAPLIAQNLSDILGVDYDTVYEKTQKTSSQYEYVIRKIEVELADEVRKFITENKDKLNNAVYLVDDTKRYYPYGNFLSHVLGFCGTDNDGRYGIEYQFEEYLAGTPGHIVSAKNGRNVNLDSDYELYYDAQDGDSLMLTIDEVIQHYLEKHVQAALESTQAAGVIGLVMDVDNANILGMCVKPDYDLNDPFTISEETQEKIIQALIDQSAEEKQKTALKTTNMNLDDILAIPGDYPTEEEITAAKSSYRQNLWVNRAVNDTYEPGSVFKIITGAMALEENLISDTDSFYCAGTIKLSGEDVDCWQTRGHGAQTFTESVMHSCNMAFVELGQRLGPNTFFKYFKAFGMTQKTGIELPGEAGGSTALYHDEKALQVDVQLGNSAFGQTFKVNPVQVITAVSAVANGGTLYKPQIVEEIVAADGSVRRSAASEVVRQVVTPETSNKMNLALEQVVAGEGGTGRNAYVKGYRVAGKTGTSQKMDKLVDGEAILRMVSFLGFAPANDPKVAVLIIVDEPQNGTVSGSALAAPVVADVIGDTLAYLGVEPQYTEEELETLDIYTPDFMGMTREEVEKRAATDGLTVTFVGEGNEVTDQMPAASAVVPRNVEMVVYMGGEKSSYSQPAPTLVGMTWNGIKKNMRTAPVKFYLRPVGVTDYDSKVLCVTQTPAPGEIIYAGDVITLDFRDTAAVE